MDRATIDRPLTEAGSRGSTVLRRTVHQDYRVFRTGRLSGYVHEAFVGNGLCDLLPRLLLSPPSSEKVLCRSFLNRDVFMVNVPIRGDSHAMFLKGIRFKSLWRLVFVDTIMPSIASRYLMLAETLKSMGIDTPTVVAVLEEKWCFGVKRSFILTEWCRNTVTLQEYGKATAIRDPLPVESARRQEIIACLARMVRLLHRNKFFHLDLKPDNILLRTETSDQPSLMLIDLDSATIVRRGTPLLSTLLKWADFVILNKHFYPITHLKERLRFLTVYRGEERSRKRFRKTRLFLLRSPVLIQLYKYLQAANLIDGSRRLLLYLRIVR